MISIIIPAFNEEKRIKKTIEAIIREISINKIKYEILVINDGSQDRTEEVVKGIKNENIKLYSFVKNKGKGSAVRYGMEKAKGNYIFFTDADLPYPPEKIITAHTMLEKGIDAVFGMRIIKKGESGYPWYRRILSKGFGVFVRKSIHIRQKDTQCGFKAFKKEVAQSIFDKMTLKGWGFDVEIVFLAEKLGFKTERIMLELSHDEQTSNVKIISDAVKMAIEVLSIRKKYKKGIYGIE